MDRKSLKCSIIYIYIYIDIYIYIYFNMNTSAQRFIFFKELFTFTYIRVYFQFLLSSENICGVGHMTGAPNEIRTHSTKNLIQVCVCGYICFWVYACVCIVLSTLRSHMGVDHSGEGIVGRPLRNAKLFDRVLKNVNKGCCCC